MAGQMHIAMSSEIKGAGMFSAWPYGMALGLDELGAIGFSLTPWLINIDSLENLTRDNANIGKIDSLQNLQNSKVYIQSGKDDQAFPHETSKKAADLYRRFGVDLKSEFQLVTNHVLPTVNTGGNCENNPPTDVFGACNYDGAKELLTHLLGDLNDSVQYQNNNFHTFNQKEFFEGAYSMDDIGIIYVPSSCAAGEQCLLHIHMHN